MDSGKNGGMAQNSTGKRGPYRVGIERRKAIIEQAAETFGINGYYGGTMREIADRAGVTPAALNRYFSGKEELLFAVMNHHLDQWRAYVDRTEGSDRRGLAYIRGIPRVVEYFEQNPGVARLQAAMMGEGTGEEHPGHDYIVGSHRSTHESFTRHIAEAVADGEIPKFTPEQIALEAAQLAMMLDGSTARILVQDTVAEGMPYPRASEVFAAFVTATVARWQAMKALSG